MAAFAEALRGFDDGRFDHATIRSHAESFAEPRFRERMHEIVTEALAR